MFNTLCVQHVKDLCLAEHPRLQWSEGRPGALLVFCSVLLVVQPCCLCKPTPHCCCSKLEIIPWIHGLHRAFGWGSTAGTPVQQWFYILLLPLVELHQVTGLLLFRASSTWCWNELNVEVFLFPVYSLSGLLPFLFLYEKCRKTSSMVLLSLLTRPQYAPFLQTFLAEFTLSNFSCLHLILIPN